MHEVDEESARPEHIGNDEQLLNRIRRESDRRTGSRNQERCNTGDDHVGPIRAVCLDEATKDIVHEVGGPPVEESRDRRQERR